MGRLFIGRPDAAAKVAFPTLQGFSASGQIVSQGVVNEADRSLSMWRHELAPGSAIAWDHPPVGHCIYVIEGAVESLGSRVDVEGAVIIEHASQGSLTATADGATVLHFHQREGHREQPVGVGGQARAVGPKGIYRIGQPGRSSTLYADADSGTSELWLHQSVFDEPGFPVKPHSHTEDEIIGGIL